MAAGQMMLTSTVTVMFALSTFSMWTAATRLRDLRKFLTGEGHVRRELCFPQPPQHQL